MRALFLNENLGGHATMHRALADCVARHDDVDAEFLTLPAPGPARRVAAARVPGLSRLDLDLNPVRYQVAQGLHARRLLRPRVVDCDVLHAYTQQALFGCGALLRSCPTVVSTDCSATQAAYRLPYRAPTRFTGVHARLSHAFEQRVLDAADMVVAQSEWAARSLRDTCEIADDRLRVIPFGLVPSDPIPRRGSRGRPLVTFVGRTLSRKGGDLLLRTWRARLRDRCDLALVTRDPVEAEPGLRVLADVEPGDGRLDTLLSESSVFAFPSEADMSPYAVLEAMFAGVPVVASEAGALPEMVVDGETGLLVTRTESALAGAVLALLDDSGRAEAMGRAGRSRALERFDARVTTDALVGVLHEAREQHRG